MKRKTPTPAPKVCAQCGREIPSPKYRRYVDADGKRTLVCPKHWGQYRRYGKFLDNIQRTAKDRNEYIYAPEGVYVVCFDKNSVESGRFLISEEDVDRVKNYKWCIDGMGYVVRKSSTGNYKLHTDLLNPPKGMVVDHINGNKLDNRRSNLRLVTVAQNGMNRRTGKNSSSQFKGVYSRSNCKGWRASIQISTPVSYVICALFSSKDINDAVYARYLAELIIQAEYRYTGNDSAILEAIAKVSPDKKAKIKEKVITRIQNAMTKLDTQDAQIMQRLNHFKSVYEPYPHT